jgi:error-prone DNA polymerase
VDVNASEALATLEGEPPAIRLGLAEVRNLGRAAADLIAAARPYRDLEDFARRAVPKGAALTGPAPKGAALTGPAPKGPAPKAPASKGPAPKGAAPKGAAPLSAAALEALATAGAFGCFGLSRRAALWAAGAVASVREGQLPGTTTGLTAPPLPDMTPQEETLADLWATSTYTTHPVAHLRPALASRHVLTIAEATAAPDDSTVAVAGLVIHRQRPPTARGVVFLGLEDETAMLNVICPPHVWDRHRRIATTAPALLIHGRIEQASGAVNLLATALRPLRVAATVPSRDFR